MRRFPIASIWLSCAATLLAASLPDPNPAQVDEIIQKFAAKEAEFQRARGNYTYRQTARVQELDDSGAPLGRWEEVTDIIFTPDGKRTEKVVRAPVSTLSRIQLDPGDIQDLRDVQPFVLTTNELPKYYIRYLGREQVDEIGTYVFAVKPKKLEPGQRYFEGEVWVDDRDLQIVKTYGRGVGLLKKGADNQYPKFETYREQIDGKYWFPTYTIANDTLQFREGPQRIKMTVRYEDYKQFKSDINIKYGDEVDLSKPPAATNPPAKKP
ncbi:MAG TPA: hypothetical protein VFA28_16765 [Bryobacteraceae bacterium]|jgi:hypothetical protein|nr:hypothetical protein [Bryobacteraceae bacterium]